MSSVSPTTPRPFPLPEGILLGLGLGGFFDGIVLHQLLQWHHMLSTRYPPTTLENLRINTLWDGLFHSATYVLVVAGLFLLWRRRESLQRSSATRMIIGALLAGWGTFNLVEGLIDHELLGIHHVNERVPADQWIAWDAGFLCWGVLMLMAGWALYAGAIEASEPAKQAAAR